MLVPSNAVVSMLLVSMLVCLLLLLGPAAAEAAKVTVDLGDSQGVTLVGALRRWDQDGNLRRPVDPKAQIDAPYVDAKAVKVARNQWVFENLPPGKYDLLIMAQDRLRVEGWEYAPVLEFDPFLPPDATVEDDAREFITEDIKGSRHYENKVVPLYMGGDRKTVRVLVMLIRDKPTSYTPGAGTMRHEIWQYTWNYGGWQKEKRTRVLDRVLLQVSELRQWTWLWDAKLGGIEVKDSPVSIEYRLPKRSGTRELKGLYPY
ncbi:MAG: hypothetical protein A2V70_07195 [Planctomycetes bacterium RBG_13_63_9]|nr:MAG: hypothetical protein A2V70_07195 [Planctomycetes bacterium RBG_13_63_9]